MRRDGADKPKSSDAPLPPLDPTIHAQARLRVMTMLAALRPDAKLAFPRLQEVLGMTAGNLSTHLRKLEEAGYVSVDKAFRGRTPVTWVALTARGRLAFQNYQEALRAYVQAMDFPPGAADGAEGERGPGRQA